MQTSDDAYDANGPGEAPKAGNKRKSPRINAKNTQPAVARGNNGLGPDGGVEGALRVVNDKRMTQAEQNVVRNTAIGMEDGDDDADKKCRKENGLVELTKKFID